MPMVQKYILRSQLLRQFRTRVLALVMIFTAVSIVGFQKFALIPGNGLLPLFPPHGNGALRGHSSSRDGDVGEVLIWGGSKIFALASHETNGIDGESDDFDIDGERQPDNEFSLDLGNGVTLKKIKDPYGGYITIEKPVKEGTGSPANMDGERGRGFVSTPSKNSETNSSLDPGEVKHSDDSSPATALLPHKERSFTKKDPRVKKHRNSIDFTVSVVSNNSLPGQVVSSDEKKTAGNGETRVNCEVSKRRRKKDRMKQPAMSISDMDRLVSKSRDSSSSMIPQWPSTNDLQILDARKQIINAPEVKSDPVLFPRVFRNISMFKRSYDLMENMLKVYIYKEGEKPIFHQPELTGIYSSEGWFMKHMEASKRFIVEDPRKAHLFYIPFSSHILQFQLYVPDSHSHTNLIDYLKQYVDTIAAKYPFWNRTCGADHFVVACHDWATHETGQAMGASIRALCNADVTEDFELGKDVSLPETYVRNRQDPVRGVGGRHLKKRPILAFFAGQMHGYLRPILLQHWGNKDPDMKVFGPVPHTGKKKAAYEQYMKSSKYCICPWGYEVNSPRVVEAIFYECVPVIISDNFVPPFFEVLNWQAFSVVVPERDVPRLKEILVSIPRRKYVRLLTGVRKVQQHFLWRSRPVKYDMFHMILHSIWYNRVFH